MMRFNFLSDEPVVKGDEHFFEFYHRHVAPGLAQILNTKSSLHTLGIFGKWGVGKSTIIRSLKKEGLTDAKIIEFDCWKYERDSLRRELLIQMTKQLGLKENFLEKIIQDFYMNVTQNVSNKFSWDWKRFFLQACFPVPLILWLALETFFPGHQTISVILFALSTLGFVLREIFFGGAGSIVNVSPVVGTTNRIDAPELFEDCFSRIVRKSSAQNIVIVVDNIDRVQGPIAREMLATLKTFLEIDENEMKNKKVVFVVPCNYESMKKMEESDEFFRKIFSVTIWLPEFISTDLHKYTEFLLKQTGDISKLLNNEDVILVINEFSSNPREIKQFINNLIAALVVALESEVADLVRANVAYLAKVLVLREKFPEAYCQLKGHWFSPEFITFTTAGEQFKKFMLRTSRITTDNAEPFVYFERPIVSREIKKSQEISAALLSGETAQANELVKKQNSEKIVDFIVSLLEKYRRHKSHRAVLLKTSLEVVLGLDMKPTKKEFYNVVASILDEDMWDEYKKIPQYIIFAVFKHPALDKHLRTNLSERYTTSTTSQETVNDSTHAVAVFSNIFANPQLFSPEQKVEISKSIENHFTYNMEVMSLLKEKEIQKAFLNDNALNKFIAHVSYENFIKTLPILFLLKEYLYEKNFHNLVFNIFNQLLQAVAKPARGLNKDLLNALKEIGQKYPEVFRKINEKQKNAIRSLIQNAHSMYNIENRQELGEALKDIIKIMNESRG